ncbi:AAA family ATPase [Amycolatopsis sp. cmx-4-54]|uniref:helix-turn-helix transcriptional regulator n=1 Tax=Amycolatopsis sp. cmx-4-54 TaxID=2790936 RepID=UPI0039794055
MGRTGTGFVGREEELAALRELALRPVVTLVRGAAGSGKSAVLARLGTALAEQGRTVLRLSIRGAMDRDPFGIFPLLTEIRERFEELDAGPDLLSPLSELSLFWTIEAHRVERGATLPGALSALLSALGGKVAILIDDADRIPRPAVLLRLARRAGVPVVATATRENARPAAEPALEPLAQHVLDLAPLSEEDTRTLIRRFGGAPVDPGVLSALRARLGDLLGNPGTLLPVLADLRRRGRFAVVGHHLCLRDPAAPIPLPDGHPRLERLRQLGEVGTGLVLLAASEATFGLAQLPAFAVATATPLPECGHALDRLVLDGVLSSDRSARLHVRHPTLADAVVERAGADAVRHLHAGIARALLDDGPIGGPGELILLEHAALAGDALPAQQAPAEPARRVQAPDRSAGHRLARARLRWRQGVGTPDSARAELIGSLLRAGRYEPLAELVAGPGGGGMTAAAGSLAAIHLGRRLPLPVRSGPAADLCDRWFAGEPITPADVERAVTPLTGERDGRPRLGPEPAIACARRDLVPVLRAVLGPVYEVPTIGPLAAYHRMCQDYAAGRWSAALSAAREVVLTGTGDPLGMGFARLLAAEMCVWRGADREAEGWLDEVPAHSALAAMRGWVDSGRRYLAGDVPGAITAGWEAYQAGGGTGPGAVELLSRLAVIAVEQGSDRVALRVLAEVEARHHRELSPRSREAWALAQGLVHGVATWVRASESMARRRDHQPDRVWALLATGLVAAEPRPWLYEGYRLATTLGGTALRAKIKRVMADRGVSAPSSRDRPHEFSYVEQQIVQLVRRGMSNRQIAATVLVSEKMVEKHLTKLYLRTGCRTRHELAAASLGGRLERVSA